MGFKHHLQRPRSTTQEKIGMLSRHAIGCLHEGHRERGRTTDWPVGMRKLQTFRKLPSMAPNAPARIIKKGSVKNCLTLSFIDGGPNDHTKKPIVHQRAV